jgi:hypothetical protein
MKPKQIFTYWEGADYPYIEYCIRTIKRKSGVEVIVMNEKNVDEWIAGGLSDNYRRLINISQKTDCIRCAVLYNHGGMWCDADTVFLKNCSLLFNKDSDFTGLRWTHNKKLLNGYFLCKKHSKFIEMCLAYINDSLDNRFRPYYPSNSGCYFGENVFNDVDVKMKCETDTIVLETFVPVNFPFKVNIWSDILNIEDFICNDTVAIGINNSQLNDCVKTTAVEYLAAQDNLMGSVLRYSGVEANVVNLHEEVHAEIVRRGLHLPKDFSPLHPQWKVPSFRNKYLNIKREIERGRALEEEEDLS